MGKDGRPNANAFSPGAYPSQDPANEYIAPPTHSKREKLNAVDQAIHGCCSSTPLDKQRPGIVSPGCEDVSDFVRTTIP